MHIPFAHSDRSTLGIEWEMLLVDADSGDLRQVAQTIIERVRPEGLETHPSIVQELLLNTVEIVTDVCRTVGEARTSIESAVTDLRAVAEPLRVDLMCAGTHPFSRWMDQRVSDKEHYARLIDRTQWWGRQMLICGLHVHVGIEDRDKVLPILNSLLRFAPHFQALSASSPYWMGEATGYASNRALLFQQLPTAGLPQQFDTWGEYEGYVEDMTTTGVIDEIGEIRWDIRPAPRLGTIEIRVCDGMPSLREVLAMAALVQCLIEDFSTRLDAGEKLPTLRPWHVSENKWRSARYGMDAIVIVDAENTEELMTDHLRRELVRLAPVAARLGCSAELADLDLILDSGASYQRQLAVGAATGGDLRSVVTSLAAEMRAERPLDTATALSRENPAKTS